MRGIFRTLVVGVVIALALSMAGAAEAKTKTKYVHGYTIAGTQWHGVLFSRKRSKLIARTPITHPGRVVQAACGYMAHPGVGGPIGLIWAGVCIELMVKNMRNYRQTFAQVRRDSNRCFEYRLYGAINDPVSMGLNLRYKQAYAPPCNFVTGGTGGTPTGGGGNGGGGSW